MITILIIDANITQANYFAGILKKENYEIQIAKTSEEALHLLENNNFYLVLLNSEMPENASLTILNKIRTTHSQNELPVITILETVNAQKEELFLESGTTCLINLPVTELSLKLRIRNMVEIQETGLQLKLKNQQQKNIFENSPVPSLLIDETGIVKEVNKAAFELFQVKEGAYFDVYCGELFNCYNALHNMGKCGTMAICSDCLIRGSINKSFRTRQNSSKREDKFKVFVNNEPQERIIIVTSIYIHDITTNLALLTFEDVTDLRKSQQIIAQKNEELTDANCELSAQAEELTQISDRLAESNQFITQIIQSAQEGIIVYDLDLHYKVWNPFMERITGLSASQVIGKHPLDFFPFLEEAGIIDNIQKNLTGEIITADDFQYHVPHTQIKGWASETSAPLRNVKGEIVGVIATVNDITQRKHNEELLKEQTEEIGTQMEEYQQLNEQLQRANNELSVAKEKAQESELKFRSYIENAPDGVFVMNPNGYYLDVNPAACALLGYSNEELLSIHASQILDGEYLEELKSSVVIIQKERKYSSEMKFVRKDGSRFFGLLSAVKINENKIIGFVKDITERKQAEYNLLEFNLRLELAMRAANMAWWEMEIATGNVSFHNRKAEMLGYTPEMFNHYSDFTKLLHPEDYDKAMKAMHEHLSGKFDRYEVEYRIQTNQGKYEWFYDIGTIVKKDMKEKPLFITGLVINITDRKEAEIKISQQNNELQELNATKDKFFSILAHDLRNPFSALLGFSDILVQNALEFTPEKVLYFAQFMNNTSKQTYTLLENLLEWARLQTGKLVPNPVKIKLSTLLYEVKILSETSAKSKNISLQSDIHADEYILADEEMIKTVLRNLVTNAMKFTHLDGVVTISTHLFENQILFVVSDTGIGIEPQHIDKLFKIDCKLSKKGTAGETGTGLGLILCKEFVEKHGGKIWVESKLGNGSDFKFTLPITPI